VERREGERYVVPEIYREYITFKFREVSGDFVDAELLNFSPNGIRIKSRYELPFDSTIECLISVPKSLTEEIPFTGKIKYCIQEEPMGDYRCGVKFIDISPEAMNKLKNFLRSFS
jgi:c-di-GMP-binding flagellar brake protein YcgR